MNINEIMSLDLLRLALRRWHILLAVLCVSLLLAGITYSVLPRKYLVTATVIGTRYESDVTPSNQSTSFSAAALLGGTTNDLPTITDFRLYTQLLTSPELGASIIDDPVIHRIYAKSWKTDHWGPPDTFLQRVENFVLPLIGQDAWSPPDGFVIAKYLQRHVSVAVGKDAKILTLSTWNANPDLGKDLIRLLNSRADQMVKLMAQKRFQAKVEFLDKAISTATVQETRTALASALARAETDQIYSFSNLPFAAELLAQPATPNEPQFPDGAVTFSGFAVLGILGFFFYLIIVKRRESSEITSTDSRVKRSILGETTMANPVKGGSVNT